jgi:hypothetical protein
VSKRVEGLNVERMRFGKRTQKRALDFTTASVSWYSTLK